MIKTSIKYLTAAVIAIAVSSSAFAQSNDTDIDRAKALSIDELLQLVKQGRHKQNDAAGQRIRQFQNQTENQERMLADIKRQLEREVARSRSLETEKNDLQTQIETLRKQKEDKQGALQEVFGNVQAAAGELKDGFARSLSQPEIAKAHAIAKAAKLPEGLRPSRIDAMDQLAEALRNEDQLPDIRSLERFWEEYFIEIIKSGEVVRFESKVNGLNTEFDCNVVRIGLFNAICDGEYMVLSESNPDRYSLLSRQPGEGIGFGGKYLGPASEFNAAPALSDETYKFGFDPTGPGGSGLLRALISVPDLEERIAQGREVGYAILALGAIGLLLAIFKLISLSFVGMRIRLQMRNVDAPEMSNPLGRILTVYKGEADSDVEALELKLSEAIARERPAIDRFVTLLKIIAAVAPLMGLLGTVTGMIDTFQQITLFGTGDPKTMAGGISQALVTTVLGLCVAIPMILLHAIVNSRASSILFALEERSIGLVAGRAEKIAQEYWAEQQAKADDEA